MCLCLDRPHDLRFFRYKQPLHHLLSDTEVTLKRNPYESDSGPGELTQKGKGARNARVDSYKSAEPHKI